MTALPAYRFRVEGVMVDVGAAGPGLGWDTCLTEAVRRWYVQRGVDQGRWVQVARHVPVGRRGTYGEHLVLTSRFEQVTVLVKPWGARYAKRR